MDDTLEPPIHVTTIGSLKARPPIQYDADRTCSNRICSTILSTYNRHDFCWCHTPLQYPRTRGRKTT